MLWPFADIELPAERSTDKPRARGLSMMADWGIPHGQQQDMLEMAGRYLDFAKIVTGTSRLYERSYLEKKLEIYREHRVRSFIGGQFFEYVLAHKGWAGIDSFFAEARALGFETIEISDNCIPLADDERRRAIEQAIAAGLQVMGEVGSKDVHNDPASLVGQAEVCFAAGAEFVLVEAAELVADGVIDRRFLDVLRDGLDLSRVMIELPGPWISGVTLAVVEDLKKLLIKELGPDVNIANLHAEDLIATEALRVGLGVVGPSRRNAD